VAGKIQEKLKRSANNSKRDTSIFFIVWSAFTVVSLIVVLVFFVLQFFILKDTYERELAKDVTEKGRQIETMIEIVSPDRYDEAGFNAFIRYLSTGNDVDIYVIDGSGKVLFPTYTGLPEGDLEGGLENGFEEDLEIRDDFSEEVKTLLPKLRENGGKSVAYAGNGEYVYGAVLLPYHGQDSFLYLCKSSVFTEGIIRQVTPRIFLVGVFVFLLSFAVSSSIAGMLLKPIVDMTEKTKRLARGDFEVDFLDGAYGGELFTLAKTLNYARDEISKADKMQKELIANVSHDFKTPLTMIKAYASMIREISGDIPEKRDKHAQVIEDEADRLASLVNDVLDLSKLRSGIDELKLTQFDVSAYLYDVLERFTYLSETQDYKFIVDVEEDLYTTADELKIGQVLYNLIGNAVNYTGEDKKVFVTLRREAQGIRFSVRDTGKGIKEEELSTIWERYYRSSETHKRPVKGTGLGLSIVKSILERHNFIFGVDSVEGAGSTFYVLFPYAIETASKE